MAARNRRPPALAHGLSSRIVREALSSEVEGLAAALIGASPREPQILDAARGAAEAILHLQRVRRLRWLITDASALIATPAIDAERVRAETLYSLWRQGCDPTCVRRIEELRQRAKSGSTSDADGEAALLEVLAHRPDELRRLAAYERRALSRRREALRRLDYERIEAERRRTPQGRRPSIGRS